MGKDYRKLAQRIITAVTKQRKTLFVFSVMVVFIATYLLILPAMTLDQDEAEKQGGIDITTEQTATEEAESGQPTAAPEDPSEPDPAAPAAGTLSAGGEGFSVATSYGKKAGLPLGTELTAEEITEDSEDYQAYRDEALKALQEEKGGEQIADLKFAKFYDITLAADGDEIEPSAPVDVTISYDKGPKVSDADHVRVVHFGTDQKGRPAVEVLKAGETDAQINKKGRMTETSFKAESFSVYAVVYTVDFHFDVDGKTFEYSMPGGGFISFTDLVEALGISADNAEFEAGVEQIEFSNPKLVDVSRVDEETTVGKIKESRGLKCEYSADLTEEQIEEINAQTVKAGDWALISLQPFTSEECLTVTMKNGEAFKIQVTDAQEDPLGLDGQAFAIVNTKGNTSTAMKPVVSNNRLQGDTVTLSQNGSTPTCSDNASYWMFEYVGDGKYYIKSGDLYLKISGTDNSNWKIELVDRDNADPITILQNGGKYRFLNDNNISINNYGGVFWAGNWNNNDEWMMLRTPYDPNKPGQRETVDSRALGLTIDLFDYGPDDGDYNLDTVDNVLGGANVDDYWEEGINEHSDLKFFSYGTGYGDGTCGINNFTGSSPNHKAAQGIVQNVLTGGYPSLQNNQSLDYLFDRSSVEGKTVYPNVNHLFWDVNGKLKYDSDESYAYYNQGTKDFKVYNTTYEEEGSTDTSTFKVGFFPFNDYDSRYRCIHGDDFAWGCTGTQNTHGVTDEVGHFNHHFGLSMTGTFEIVPNQDMTFHFSGDDDLWVFVDGVLVLDIGGIHNPIEGSIDFGVADGAVSVSPNVVAVDGNNDYLAPNTIKAAFEKAGKTWDGSDGSYHEIKVFYLERGGMYSNLDMEINLPLVPSGDLQFDKKDDSGAGVPGAKFQLYTDANCEHPLSYKSEDAAAVSDSNGVVTFTGIPVGEYYMKETAAPAGYKPDSTVYEVTIKDSNYPELGSSFIKDPAGNIVTEILNEKKQIIVSVQKEWAGGVPDGATAKFALKRTRSYEGDVKPAKSTINVYRVGWNNNTWDKAGKSELALTRVYAGDSTANLSWTYWQYYGSNWSRTEYYVGDTRKTDGPNVEVFLPAGETTNVYICDGNLGGQYANGVETITITGDDPNTVTPTHISAEDEEDTEFNNHAPAHEFPVGTTNWTYTFPAQEVEALRSDGLVETYKYYIEEVSHSPADWNVSFSPSTLTESGTITATNYKNEVYVEKRWYDVDGNLLNPQPTDQVSVTLSSPNSGQISGDRTKNITAQSKGTWSVEDNGSKLYEATETALSDYDTTYSFKDIGDVAERTTGGVHRGGTIYVNNKQKVGSIQITKTVKKNGSIDAGATGTFYYAVFDEEFDASANPAQMPIRSGSITITADGTATVTENKLPYGTYYVYELTGQDGTPIISGADGAYRKIEETVYHVEGSGSSAVVGETAGSVQLTNNTETVNKTATKTWSDNADHPTIYFKLFYEVNNGLDADGHPDIEDMEVDGAEIKELVSGTTSTTWEDLPKYDENGNEYMYLVKEYIMNDGTLVPAAPDGYVKTEGGLSVTNTKSEGYTPLTTYSGTKTWVDTANNGATRPDALHVTLYANGTATDYMAQWTKGTGNKANEWTYTFSDLPVFDANGNYISYTAREAAINGYDADEPVTTATRYQRLESQDPARNTKNSSLDITLEEETDLAYIAIKKNAHTHLIWTQRVITADEKQKLYNDINETEGFIGEMNDSTVEFVSGLPIEKLFEKGTVTVTKADNKTLHVTFVRQNQWAQLCYGSYRYEYAPGTTSFTNRLHTISADATKAWLDASGTELTPDAGTTVTFDLFIGNVAQNKRIVLNGKADVASEDALSEDVAIAATQEVNPEAVASKAYESEPWKAYWGDLAEYDSAGEKITYTVKEVVVPEGFVNQNAGGVSTGGTITNKQSEVEIHILKVEMDGTTPLTGAKFKLRRYPDDNYQEYTKEWDEQEVSSESATKGQLTFSGISVGYYELEETESPAGYVRDGEPVRFVVSADANDNIQVTFTNTAMVTYDTASNTFIVKNEPGAALPSSGGSGTTWIYLLGTILLLGSAILLAARRRASRP